MRLAAWLALIVCVIVALWQLFTPVPWQALLYTVIVIGTVLSWLLANPEWPRRRRVVDWASPDWEW